ncbi:MAG: hypothetical protein EOP53_17015 [Sphingobacteriales bacterium]|nr:MAG: hypothetical protein EOP53_17015 [Sphingobacteriales bacterium]
MKNVLTYFVLLSCILIYAVSLSEPLTKKIVAYKYRSSSILASDKYRYGDLFGMSYYPNIMKDPSQEIRYEREKCDSITKDIDLYALCDSYVWSFLKSDTFYCNVNKLMYATVNNFDYLQSQLDTTKTNVLLFEFSERNVMFMVRDKFDYMKDFLKISDTTNISYQQPPNENLFTSYLFNKNINTNLEFNIFEASLFTGIKKIRATINFDFLKTPNKDVLISPDNKYMLYQQTIDPASMTSSFTPISDNEIDTVVSRLNQIYGQYMAMGFREVYLSIIPNTVSILYPDLNGYKYNNLILRIQNHPSLKIPIIDIYSEFKKTKAYPVFLQTDTHWNMNGAFLWLNTFNRTLRNIER